MFYKYPVCDEISCCVLISLAPKLPYIDLDLHLGFLTKIRSRRTGSFETENVAVSTGICNRLNCTDVKLSVRSEL